MPDATDQPAPAPPPDPASTEEPVYCPKCGYDVRGISSTRCPECGVEIDIASLRKSQIPWSYRGEIGRLRAYWKTVWRVTFKTQQFCAEAVRPVNYRDARRFQSVTVAHVYLAIVGVLLLAWFADGDWDDLTEPFGPTLTWVLIGYEAVALWFALLAATGLHTYWFHPKSLSVTRQNRAVALGYYACGPLALMPMVTVLFAVVVLLAPRDKILPPGDPTETLTLIVALVGEIVLAISAIGYWLTGLRMVRVGVGRGAGATLLCAVIWPMLWAIAAGLILIGMPALCVYGWLMLDATLG